MGYNLTKLLSFMNRVVSEGDGIIFFDDGKQFIIQVNAADSQSITAVMPSGGRKIEPISIKRTEFSRAYRQDANLSGADGKLNMSKGNWRMALAGAIENMEPSPIIISGKKLITDVGPLKSVPTEDTYGGSMWAFFLPDGVAAICSTYSMVAINMDKKVWPDKSVVMQANAIFPLINLKNSQLVVSEYVVGVTGQFMLSPDTSADIYIALAKPNTPAPSVSDVKGMIPGENYKVAVLASELKECIEGAKKTFEEDATNLTFAVENDGLSISLQSPTAALKETVSYIKVKDKPKNKLVVNTDVTVNAFKGMADLAKGNAVACLDWNDQGIFIRIVSGKKPLKNGKVLGSLVIAPSED